MLAIETDECAASLGDVAGRGKVSGMNDRGSQSETTNTHQISTQEVCRLLDISKRTLQNWEKSGMIPKVPRDWRGYRIFTEKDVEDIRRVIQQKAERNRAT